MRERMEHNNGEADLEQSFVLMGDLIETTQVKDLYSDEQLAKYRPAAIATITYCQAEFENPLIKDLLFKKRKNIHVSNLVKSSMIVTSKPRIDLAMVKNVDGPATLCMVDETQSKEELQELTTQHTYDTVTDQWEFDTYVSDSQYLVDCDGTIYRARRRFQPKVDIPRYPQAILPIMRHLQEELKAVSEEPGGGDERISGALVKLEKLLDPEKSQSNQPKKKSPDLAENPKRDSVAVAEGVRIAVGTRMLPEIELKVLILEANGKTSEHPRDQDQILREWAQCMDELPARKHTLKNSAYD